MTLLDYHHIIDIESLTLTGQMLMCYVWVKILRFDIYDQYKWHDKLEE